MAAEATYHPVLAPPSKLSTADAARLWVCIWLSGLWLLSSLGALISADWLYTKAAPYAWLTLFLIAWLACNLAMDQIFWRIDVKARSSRLVDRFAAYARAMRGCNIVLAILIALGQGICLAPYLDLVFKNADGPVIVITASSVVAIALLAAGYSSTRNRTWLFWSLLATAAAIAALSAVQVSVAGILIGLAVAAVFFGAIVWLPGIVEVRSDLSPLETTEVAVLIYGTIMAIVGVIVGILAIVYMASSKNHNSNGGHQQVIPHVIPLLPLTWIVCFAAAATTLQGSQEGLVFQPVKVYASGQPVLMQSISADGQPAADNDPMATFYRGRVFVRTDFCESLGIQVSYDHSNGIALLQKNGEYVYLQADNNRFVARAQRRLPNMHPCGPGGLQAGRIPGPPPMLIHGMVAIPLRLAVTMIGCDAQKDVHWQYDSQDKTNDIDITLPPNVTLSTLTAPNAEPQWLPTDNDVKTALTR